MPRALVTGAAGFIGSPPREFLLQRGFSLIGRGNPAPARSSGWSRAC